jgi:hypothetical protein
MAVAVAEIVALVLLVVLAVVAVVHLALVVQEYLDKEMLAQMPTHQA